MEKVRQARFKVVYEGVDITEEIQSSVVEIYYIDNLDADDQVEITVENRDGRWFRGYFPEDGDEIKVWIGWENLCFLGKFSVKKIRFSVKEFTATITAVSSNVKKSIRRTKKNRSFENTTLEKIPLQIAEENGLKPLVDVPHIPIKRIDQTDQTDAHFLKELAKKFSCTFKLAGDKLVFMEEKKLEALPPSAIITADDLIEGELESNAGKIYRACEVCYYDATEGREKKYLYELPEKVGEVLRTRQRVENLQQAIALAKSLLRQKNKLKQKVNLTLPGLPLFAGQTFELKGFGRMDGKYIVETSTHRVRGVWETSVEARRCLNF